MKFFKFFVLTFFFLSVFSYFAINFIHNKMEEEYLTYYSLSNKINQLNDTYSLCSGLMQVNPSKENVESCNLVFTNIELTVKKIKEQTPYIYYYTLFINDI